MFSKPFFNTNSITKSLAEECEKVYPLLLREVYKRDRPKSVLGEVLADDEWRYTTLPRSFKVGEGLSKEQLARLVKWKITHGVYRPFLPGMVQKNSDIEVADHTTNAVKVLSPLSPSQTKKEITIIIISALDRVCKLKGVGPATGTLVLSVFKPDVVPFFQDELFAWLIPEHSAKLKYDKKEYGMLLDRALDIVLEKNIEADKLEKTAYVLMHADLLTKEQKQQLLSSDEKSELDSIEQPRGHQTSEDGDDDQSKEHKKVHQSQVKPVPKSRKAAVEEDESSLRRSKRRKA